MKVFLVEVKCDTVAELATGLTGAAVTVLQNLQEFERLRVEGSAWKVFGSSYPHYNIKRTK